MATMPRLNLVMRGIKVNQGKKGCHTVRKQPVTPDLLRKIKLVWAQKATDPDKIMLWAASTLCFFGFFRSGEITVPSNAAFDPLCHLMFPDLVFDDAKKPELVKVRLKASKTDPFREGVDVTIGMTGDDLCPVAAILAYLAVRGGDRKSPLFHFKNGIPLSRSRFVLEVKKALEQAGVASAGFAGHSFRAGAATTAALVGIDDAMIQTLGRWRSSAYLLYIRIPRNELRGVAKRLSGLKD